METNLQPLEWWNNLSPFWQEIFRIEILHNIDIPCISDENYDLQMESIITNLWQVGSLDLSFDKAKNNRKRITSLKALLPFKNITHLNLNGNTIQSNGFKFIYHLKNLKKLELLDNQLDNIQPLSNFPNLEILELGNNQLTDITPLNNLIHLTSLGLSNNQIECIEPLKNLYQLKQLFIFSNQVKKIDGLSNLINLENLALGKNFIHNINPLAKLHNLRKLALGANPFLRDISVLQNLNNLKKLGLNDNIHIDNIMVLKNLHSLRWVSLYKVPCKKSELDELKTFLPLCHIETNRKLDKT